MNKKGLDPVIATVIIVAVAIAISIAVAYLITGITPSFNLEDENETVEGEWSFMCFTPYDEITTYGNILLRYDGLIDNGSTVVFSSLYKSGIDYYGSTYIPYNEEYTYYILNVAFKFEGIRKDLGIICLEYRRFKD